MATSTKKTASRGKGKAASHKGKSDRCWSGYEPVPGKKPYSKGSCRKKS